MNSKKPNFNLPGGGKAVFAFFLSLIAYTLQTEFAQYVQQTLNYRKPFLSLYLGHSGFLFVLPMHLLFLRLTTKLPTRHYLELIASNLNWQLDATWRSESSPPQDLEHSSSSSTDTQIAGSNQTQTRSKLAAWTVEKLGFDATKLFAILTILTVGITIPALSWYSAVPLTSMADITAIYNTFSVWALVFSVWFLGEKWEKRKVLSVLLACVGVFIVAYGGSSGGEMPPVSPPSSSPPTVANHNPSSASDPSIPQTKNQTTNPILGDLLAFIGSVTMAGFEMVFKRIATLPDEKKQADMYRVGQRKRSRSYIEYRTNSNNNHIEDGNHREENQGLLLHAEAEADQEAVTKPTFRGIIDDEGSYDPIHTASAARSLTTFDEQASIWNSRATGDDYLTMTLPDSSEEELGTNSPNKKKVDLDRAVRIQTNPVVLHHHGGGLEDDSELDEEEHQTPTADTATSTTLPFASYDETAPPPPPPPLPFGLHANVMTSGLGLITLLLLWIGIPIAHVLGWETFELPPDLWTLASIGMVVCCGIFFNGSFMILLSLWGPVLASVSCLMTTVLVEIADVVLGHPLKWINLIGCFLIVAGFAVLASGGVE